MRTNVVHPEPIVSLEQDGPSGMRAEQSLSERNLEDEINQLAPMGLSDSGTAVAEQGNGNASPAADARDSPPRAQHPSTLPSRVQSSQSLVPDDEGSSDGGTPSRMNSNGSAGAMPQQRGAPPSAVHEGEGFIRRVHIDLGDQNLSPVPSKKESGGGGGGGARPVSARSTGGGSGGGANTALLRAQATVGRSMAGNLRFASGNMRPPDELPDLHMALFEGDIDWVRDLLHRNRNEPLSSHMTIYVNRKWYPEGALYGDGHGPPHKFAMPTALSMETAADAMRALLRGEYLAHACHPVTIAAARGDVACLELLLKHMTHYTRKGEPTPQLTWSERPACVPRGCPWVTPLTAAALAGSGECVQLLVNAMSKTHRGKPTNDRLRDRSSWGCFGRFKPLVVAQSADAVEALFATKCVTPDELYKLSDIAKSMARAHSTLRLSAAVPLGVGAYTAAGGQGTTPGTARAGQPREAASLPFSNGSYSVPAGVPGEVPQPGDPPLPPLLASPPSLGGVPAVLKPALSGLSGGILVQAQPPANDLKVSELMLLRARLFLDAAGTALSTSLRNFSAASQVALNALCAFVEKGLAPDYFLSFPEPHQTSECSCTLLATVVACYPAALKSAANGSSLIGAGRAGAGAAGAGGRTSVGSVSPSGGSFTLGSPTPVEALIGGGAVGPVLQQGSEQLAQVAAQSMDGLLSVLLAKGASADEFISDPRCPGGSKTLPPNCEPEKSPADQAFACGPQDLVVLLLQYSSCRPRSYVSGGMGAGAAAGGAAAGCSVSASGGSALGHRQSSMVAAQHATEAAAAAAAVREAARTGTEQQRAQHYSPLLAFSCKAEEYMEAGVELPQWLHNCRYQELMEDLIHTTIAAGPQHTTDDLQWLVTYFEQCMAAGHQTRRRRGSRAAPGVASPRPSGGEHAAAAALDPDEMELQAHLRQHNNNANANNAAAGGRRSAGGARPAVDVEVGPGTRLHLPGGVGVAESTESPPLVGSPTRRSTAGGAAAGAAAGAQNLAKAAAHALEPIGSFMRVGSGRGHAMDAMDSSGSEDEAAGGANDVQLFGRRRRRRGSRGANVLEDDVSILAVHNLYRATAEAIAQIHQEARDALAGNGLAGAASVSKAAASAVGVDWNAMLRIVARIAAVTLNPSHSLGPHSSAQSDISVFVAAKAVGQLLYARDWALPLPLGSVAGVNGAGNGGGGGSSTVVDLELLKAVARRFPHEAARLIHGMELSRIELQDINWDNVPMSLGPEFFAVMPSGPHLKIKGGMPFPKLPAAQRGSATAFPHAFAASPGGAASDSDDDGDGPGHEHGPLTRFDILQACIFYQMWSVLVHFLLVSRKLPSYMATLQQRRGTSYVMVALAFVRQYGSIPVAVGLALLLLALGAIMRGLLAFIRFTGNLVIRGVDRVEQQLQPALNQVGRKLQLQRVRAAGHDIAQRAHLTHSATGKSHAFMSMRRELPRFLASLRVLLDEDMLAEACLGVTHLSRKTQIKSGQTDSAIGDKRTTRIICSRVPLPCAAAMPSALLYTLASSPQVNAEMFASPTMRAIIAFRWQHFTRYILLLQMIEHLVYTGLFMVYAFSLSYSHDELSTVINDDAVNVAQRTCVLPPTGLQQALLIPLAVLTFTGVVQELRQLYFFKLGWFQQPWNLLDAASVTIMSCIIGLHLSCQTSEDWLRGLASVEVVLLFLRLLYFAMADDRLGSFFRMVIEVIKDLSLFFVFLGIIFVGFGLALTVMQGDNTPMRITFMQLFTMIFGDFSLSLLENADAGSAGLDDLYRVFVSAYQVIVTIILLNLLIAIINDSFERVNDAEAWESLRNKVTLIVEAESVLPYGLYKQMLERLARRDLYVVKPETATWAGQDEGEEEQDDADANNRLLQPPARWSGRVAETKRFVTSVIAQIGAQQATFARRVFQVLNNIKADGGAAAPSQVLPLALRSGAGVEAAASVGRHSTRMVAGSVSRAATVRGSTHAMPGVRPTTAVAPVPTGGDDDVIEAVQEAVAAGFEDVGDLMQGQTDQQVRAVRELEAQLKDIATRYTALQAVVAAQHKAVSEESASATAAATAAAAAATAAAQEAAAAATNAANELAVSVVAAVREAAAAATAAAADASATATAATAAATAAAAGASAAAVAAASEATAAATAAVNEAREVTTSIANDVTAAAAAVATEVTAAATSAANDAKEAANLAKAAASAAAAEATAAAHEAKAAAVTAAAEATAAAVAAAAKATAAAQAVVADATAAATAAITDKIQGKGLFLVSKEQLAAVAEQAASMAVASVLRTLKQAPPSPSMSAPQYSQQQQAQQHVPLHELASPTSSPLQQAQQHEPRRESPWAQPQQQLLQQAQQRPLPPMSPDQLQQLMSFREPSQQQQQQAMPAPLQRSNNLREQAPTSPPSQQASQQYLPRSQDSYSEVFSPTASTPGGQQQHHQPPAMSLPPPISQRMQALPLPPLPAMQPRELQQLQTIREQVQPAAAAQQQRQPYPPRDLRELPPLPQDADLDEIQSFGDEPTSPPLRPQQSAILPPPPPQPMIVVQPPVLVQPPTEFRAEPSEPFRPPSRQTQQQQQQQQLLEQESVVELPPLPELPPPMLQHADGTVHEAPPSPPPPMQQLQQERSRPELLPSPPLGPPRQQQELPSFRELPPLPPLQPQESMLLQTIREPPQLLQPQHSLRETLPMLPPPPPVPQQLPRQSMAGSEMSGPTAVGQAPRTSQQGAAMPAQAPAPAHTPEQRVQVGIWDSLDLNLEEF